MEEFIKKKLKLSVFTDEQDIMELLNEIPKEIKEKVLDSFVFDVIVLSIERHLQGKSDFCSWDTEGWRSGQKIRQAIIKVQGIEPEYKKDLEWKIKNLEGKVKNYKKYYDWYWKIYHNEELREIVAKKAGLI